MNLPIEEKLEFMSEVLENFTKNFEVVTMRRHAKIASESSLRGVRVQQLKPAL
jgi:fructose-1,6-bisphosphatase/sedoheptulose 1,7-bisphosphatase-like protein